VVSLISSITSFQSYQILSSERKLLIPSFPESQDEIPSKGRSLPHPKICISECEPFSQKKLKFFKGFSLFSFKINLLEFIKTKDLFGVQNLLIWIMNIFKQFIYLKFS
jgi:hypothetical protein